MVLSSRSVPSSPDPTAPAFRAALTAIMALALASCSPAGGKKEEAQAAQTSSTVAEPDSVATAPAAALPSPESSSAPTNSGPTNSGATNSGATPQIDEPTDLIALSIVDAEGTKWMGSPTRGKKIFRQCTSCHVLEAGQAMIGPSLHAIIGRKAGSEANFRYSTANKNSGIVWTEQALFDYLENPRAKIPGTIMSFAGIRKQADRAHLIAFLKNPDAAQKPQ